MAWCMSFAPSKYYVIELPRNLKKTESRQLYTAIEELKNGYMCDMRNKGKEVYFDEPNVVVFTSSVPRLRYMDRRRWKLWCITHDHQLVEFDQWGYYFNYHDFFVKRWIKYEYRQHKGRLMASIVRSYFGPWHNPKWITVHRGPILNPPRGLVLGPIGDMGNATG